MSEIQPSAKQITLGSVAVFPVVIVDYSFLDAALATSDLSTCRRSRCSSIVTAEAPATEEDAATARAAGAPVPYLELGLKICDELEEADLVWRQRI